MVDRGWTVSWTGADGLRTPRKSVTAFIFHVCITCVTTAIVAGLAFCASHVFVTYVLSILSGSPTPPPGTKDSKEVIFIPSKNENAPLPVHASGRDRWGTRS